MHPKHRIAALCTSATLAAVGLFWWATAPDPADTSAMQDAARASLKLRASNTPTLRERVDPPAPDWDRLLESYGHDLEGLLAEHGPSPHAPDHALRTFHAELLSRGLLDDDVRRFYPRFQCETRCSSNEPVWSGSHDQCLESCALDALARSDADHLAWWVMGLAAEHGNADLYRDVAVAYPNAWRDFQAGLATGGPRASLTVLWGQTVRSTAPGLQSSLYAFGKQQQGVVGRVAVAASGRTACVWIDNEAVCP